MWLETFKTEADNAQQLWLVDLDRLMTCSSEPGLGLLYRKKSEVVGALDVDGEEQLEPPGSQSLSESQHSSKSEGQQTGNLGPPPGSTEHNHSNQNLPWHRHVMLGGLGLSPVKATSQAG